MLRAKKRFLFATLTRSEIAVMRRLFGSVIMTKINFKVKRGILLQNWGACVDTGFWHVSRRSVAKEEWFYIV